MHLFFRQFIALFRKNWIVLSKHKLLNLLRCFMIPIGYGVFLSGAQIFLSVRNDFGIGNPISIYNITTQFDGSKTLLWADETGGAGNPSASAVMAHITSGFNERQRSAVKQVDSSVEIPLNCPQNFNWISECFAGIVFSYLPLSSEDTTPINYTIIADAGLGYVNVHKHTSDFETRILPLQLALDEAFIILRTGQSIPTPLEWPYSQETNEQQATDIRLSYIRGIRNLLVLALLICYIGISYQLPGAFTGERANLLTSHMKAVGLLDSARIVSWHVSMSLAYLPGWIIVALTWHYRIFVKTNVGLVLVVHLLLGFSLASWSFFVAAPFGKSPQLAAVASTFLAILLAVIASVFSHAGTVAATIFTLIFPPGYYVFAIRAICGYENALMPTNPLKPDPENNPILLPIMMACIINIFLWPYLGLLLERYLYDAKKPSSGFWSCFRRRTQAEIPPHPSSAAISIKNLRKTYARPMFSREKGPVIAISNLSLDIPKSGIFVLLGSNGAGKSTLVSIIADLLGRTSGSITFEGGAERPPRGTLGIVPQKNVLFPDLTCYQTLRVWHAIKYSSHSTGKDEDYEQLLRDCDLGKKIHSNANTLSGGQKRKLQLAIGLIGGSKVILVDECTSGVDPLSRRAIWKTLTSAKKDRAIVFTTHFLDEADLLADHIAILAAPGKVVAEGSPVTLKTNLGQGYNVQVTFDSSNKDLSEKTAGSSREILDRIREFAPQCMLSQPSPTISTYCLKSKNSVVVEEVLQFLDDETERYHIASVDVLGTTIEGIFLDLMESESRALMQDSGEKSVHSAESASIIPGTLPAITVPPPLVLADGRARLPFSQALTIFYKRVLIARRSWLAPALAVLTAVCGACVPLIFLTGQTPSCAVQYTDETLIPLYWADSPIGYEYSPTATFLESPPNITAMLGSSGQMLTQNVPDNATFVSTIQQDYLDIPIGGISIDTQTGSALIAWDASPPPGFAGPMLLNLATNILYNNALNVSNDAPSIIMANYASFPAVDDGTMSKLKWVVFFGAAMAIYPAFSSLYVSRERRTSVQAMQFSNGLSDPIGLWLGHLLWDSIFGIVIATVVIIVFAAVSKSFRGLGLFWVVLAEYSIVGTLFSYCVSLFMSSPLTSFVVAGGYQAIMFCLYLGGYLLTLTFADSSRATRIITIVHFTLSLLSPIASVGRSAFISVNLFSLLCDGSTTITVSSMGDIMHYGGPILYLFAYGFVLFGILVLADSGSIFPHHFLGMRKRQEELEERFAIRAMSTPDVAKETRAVAHSTDVLRVLSVNKTFNGNKVVDDISFGVSENVIFALLGPNGGGKTTTFNMIRGDVVPDSGDVEIKGTSMIQFPRKARLALGVCPQFTAIDAHLTVREHLMIYGRLKGLARGWELNTNVVSLMMATALDMYADRLASHLSGGNQRKLALAIALMGNPSVMIIDEFSTGVDVKMKRDMWGTLRNVATGKAVVITTHSMEEASALANKVGILSSKMLAIGTAEELSARYVTYHVQFSCRTQEDVIKAQTLMQRIPGARLADDVATRFEVPICSGGRSGGGDGGGNMSLAHLFNMLASQGDFQEYTVEKATLESVFLNVIRRHNVLEEGRTP